MKPTTLYYLPAFLLGALIACSNTDDPIIDEDLLGVVWRVDSLQTPEETIAPGPDTLMTVQFAANRDLWARYCNRFDGTYMITEIGSIAIEFTSVTEAACTGRYGYLDGIFSNALEQSTQYEIVGERLTMHNDSLNYALNLSKQSN